LRPSEGKNPVKTKNEKYVPITYTFHITKWDEIFFLVVFDVQVVVPKGLKIPPLEQCKKRGFCKFHNFLRNKTSQCVLFRDLVQRALNEGRLKFGDKLTPQMKVDVDPLKVIDAMYIEIVDCNVAEAIIDVVEKLSIEANVDVVECQMVEATEGPKVTHEVILESQFVEKMKVAYPLAEEELIDFINRCKLKFFEVMLCPICSYVFNKEATKGIKGFIPKSKKRGKWFANHRPKFSFAKSYIPFTNNSSTTNYIA